MWATKGKKKDQLERPKYYQYENLNLILNAWTIYNVTLKSVFF